MTTSGADLTKEQKAVLDALADVLVPRSGGWPSASEAEVGARWAERALLALPELTEALTDVLDEAGPGDAKGFLRRLEEEDRPRFDMLVLVVVGAYYLSPKVRRRLGYTGPQRTPAGEGEAELYLEDGILEPVKARGSIYRRA